MVSLVSSSWLVIRDFHAVLGAHEALGSRSPARGSCEDFRLMIDDCDLSSPVVGSPPQVIIYKLRNLKKALKSWNLEVFWDLNSTIVGKSVELHSIQLDLSNQGFSDDLFITEASVHSELDVLLRRHECFYRDWSRVRWLRDGDRNTSFFHASIKRRQYRNTISTISINGVLSEDRPTIRDHIISYYSSLFSSDVSRVGRDLSIVDDVIPSLVTVVENAFLTSVPSADDIHDAVFTIDAASAPRPDGFFGSFYQRCWDDVGSDMVLAVQDFFITGVIFLGLNSSFIVLLPKLRDSISIDQFQPIVLSNFLFKISSKILADRLARVAARIISHQQFGFIRDRHIEDCIALASDCVNVLQKKCYRGNLAMKIDIRKAFDTLDWSFLCRVLQAFGFSSVFMDWIYGILRSSRLSILFNGVPEGYFCCSRGVRQGDPLSPLLFGIAEDFLSKLLTRGTQKNMKYIMDTFRDYGDISGQLVNWGKSSIYFGSSISPSRIGSLQSLVGMQIGQLLFSYLGVPLFRDKPRKAVLRPIADKILSKFANWKSKSLSLAGRATLIRSAITGSFVHSFMIYKWSSSLLSLSNRKLRNFLWAGSCKETKLANSRDGRVSCKTAYSQFLRDISQVVWWRDVWSRFILSSRSALTRRLMLNRLPTEDRLCKSGFQLASRCSIYGVRILWKVAIHAMIWRVWTARNQWIFEEKSVDFRSILSLVWHAVLEANHLDIGCMRNCMDDFLILRRFGLQGRPSKAPVIKSVIWSPPAPG
ncbi:hypothetical protein LWI28_002180 [Acer negundo]|uniref:Reverse transcriptase domain-containing protein n=1 Tax=Acer negundo TaxID=4023 RepID=A0AAD5JS90_ACENE|nr:hypothetical protein LWI28_002180 [Acer negundo]